MNRVKICPHYIPTHGRPEDLAFVAANPGPSVKVVYSSKPDAGHLRTVLARTGDRLVIVRDHALSEQHGDARRNPVETGIRHAREWRQHLDEIGGLDFDRILVEGLNEPPVWETVRPFVDYSVTFAVEAHRLGLKTVLLNLAVGWPGNGGEGEPPDWTPWEPLLAWIDGHPGHYLGLHEYWGYNTGVQHYAGWWFLRYRQMRHKVPTMLTELGGLRAYQNPDGSWGLHGAQGWKGDAAMTPAAYVAQWQQAEAELRKDPTIHSAHLFTTDGGHPWIEQCDANPCNGIWLDWANRQPELGAQSQPTQVYVPVVNTPTVAKPPAGPQTDEDNGRWQRSIDFILRWEGGLSLDPEDHGNWTGGHKGQGELKGTKFGISAGSYPHLDIRNLTREQAIEIYRRDYWQASGADRQPWPLCLLVMDTAVLHGVGAAQAWLKECGPDAYGFAAKRLRVYRQADNGDRYWRGWIGRLADVLDEMRA